MAGRADAVVFLSDSVFRRRYTSDMSSDWELLRQFAREHSQDAFAEIVRRHVNLVYSAALRQVRSPQLAEDVSQSVFSDLSRNADKLKSDTHLTAWLYAVTRRTAIDVVRKESRRQWREQIAVEMQTMNATADEWLQIEPLLDEAMAALDETDRTAILLRYFENKNLRDVGVALKVSDDAAQKRCSRAIERLREFFSSRKLAIGSAGLVTLISANAIQAAPAALVTAISTVVLAGTTASTSTVIATTKALAMTTLQKTVITSALVAAIGTGVFEARQNSRAQHQVQTLQQQQSALAGQVQQLQRERDQATNLLSDVLAENTRLKSGSNQAELMKLRGQVGFLRSQLANANSHAAAQKSTGSPDPTVDNGLNQAMLDYLGSPVPMPSNINFAYTKEGLMSAFQNMAQALNLNLKRIEIDDSEFPYLVGVEVENKNQMQLLKDQIRKMPEYNYTGGVGGDTRMVMNIIPFGQYPAGRHDTIENRLILRESMFNKKLDVTN
ncbi:MAG TPA: sigma-70 family RNA polymerase sigma factor [Verrucomicrobiae bacterium]|nr:sigma-70 family RNA polymerase sigma factor [Verrucomicrobiae bacterium]